MSKTSDKSTKVISPVDVCQECKALCCKIGGADFTKKEMEVVLEAGYPDYFVKLSENHYELLCEKGECPYLNEENRCSIYHVRPLVCRSFPVYVNLNNTEEKHTIISCSLSDYLTEEEIAEKKKMVDEVENIIKNTFSASMISKEDQVLIQKRFNIISKTEDVKIFSD